MTLQDTDKERESNLQSGLRLKIVTRQMPDDPTYMRNREQSKSRKQNTEQRGAGGRGNGEMFHAIEFRGSVTQRCERTCRG